MVVMGFLIEKEGNLIQNMFTCMITLLLYTQNSINSDI